MTTTARNLATEIHNTNDVTLDFATEAVENYVSMIEFLDESEIDRDAIDDLDAGFIMLVFSIAQHAREAAAAGGTK